VTATSEAHADAFVLHGIISELSGNPDAAERSYRAALERDPNAHAAANNLAMVILGRNGDADEAADLAQRAVDTSPTTAEYLDTLAQAHARAGRYEPAIAAMQRAIRVDPGRAAWQWNLLDLYEAADMDTEADQ